MTNEVPVLAGWRDEVVVTRNRGGEQVLLSVCKRRCNRCCYGVLVETIWGSEVEEAERIEWCRSCFNAVFERVELDEGLRGDCRKRVQRIDGAAAWSCARPAIEDLERRGLL